MYVCIYVCTYVRTYVRTYACMYVMCYVLCVITSLLIHVFICWFVLSINPLHHPFVYLRIFILWNVGFYQFPRAEHRTLEPGGWLVEVDGGLQGWIDLGMTFVLKMLGKQKHT